MRQTVETAVESRSVPLRVAFNILEEQGIRARRAANRPKSMQDYVENLTDPGEREKWLNFYVSHKKEFETAPAGAKHHHWWVGGLHDHCCEMMGAADDLFALYPGKYNSFTLDEVTQAVFLHDFPKIWWYRPITEEERSKKPDKFEEKQVFTYVEGVDKILDAENKMAAYLMRWGLPVSEKVWSAVIFAEGGFSKAHFRFGGTTGTSASVSKHNHLAAFMHCLDMMSSQIWGRSLT